MCRHKLIQVTHKHNFGDLFLCEKELSPTEEDIIERCPDMDYEPDMEPLGEELDWLEVILEDLPVMQTTSIGI